MSKSTEKPNHPSKAKQRKKSSKANKIDLMTTTLIFSIMSKLNPSRHQKPSKEKQTEAKVTSQPAVYYSLLASFLVSMTVHLMLVSSLFFFNKILE